MKSLWLIFLPLLLVFLFSCNNDLINYEKSSSDASNDKIHIVKGYISLSGAVPEEVIPSPSVNAAERSAVPIIDSDYKYFVEAVRTDDIDGTGKILIDDEAKFVPAENGTKGFEIPLSEGSWIVTCGVKNIATNKTVLSQTFSAPVEITPDETVADLHFVVVPQESGEGNIELKLSAVSPVTSIKAFCSDEKWEAVVSGEVKVLEKSGSEYTLKVDNLESGVYNITFKFYGNSDVILFQTTQTVNVLPGMTTKKWVSGGGSDGTVISDGKLTFTTNNIRKIFYVGDSYYGSEKIASATATGEGSFYLPVDNLQRVFDIINSYTDSSADDYTIYVSRKVSGVTSVPSTITTAKAKSITIEGVTGNTVDILDGENNGSVLTVDSEVPVIIKNLKITGGSGSDLSDGSLKNGGGIYINKGTVKLTDGVIVTGNKVAANGGGVYLAGSDANLFMYGKALIGDSAKSLTRASASESNRGNQAGNGAGIYNDGGSVYIGYDSEEHEEPVYSDSTSWYGVRRNYSTSNGAGIFHSSGKLFIASGDISYNLGSSYGSGGGIYCGGKVSFSGGTVKGNSSKSGGGIFVKSSAEVSVSGNVIISGNEASENGGAVYQNGTFNLSGSVSIPYGGSEKKNDVYLYNSKTVSIAGELTPPAGITAVATITPSSWNRGTKYLSSKNAAFLSNAKNKIALSKDNSGWDKKDDIATSSSETKFAWITSPVYVVGTSASGSSRPDSAWGWGNTAANGATGTKGSPYSSIAEAVAALDLDKATEPNTIIIAGTLVGAMQEISSPSADITIKGWKAAGAEKSDAKIQRFASKPSSSQTNGSVLSISASGKTVTITDLTLTYGAAGYGAGINLSAGTLKLGDYAKITGNAAGNSGGGVLVDTGATLFMYGKALIGDKLSTDTGITTATGKSDCANSASEQGGAGIHNKGATYIGYNGFKADGTTPNPCAIDSGYGIIRNAAFKNEGGGGIKNNGTLLIGSGSISYNYAATAGGGINCNANATISGGTFVSNNSGGGGGAIYVSSSKTVTIDGGATFTKNRAKTQGGVICNWGTLNMSAGTIGGSAALDANTVTDDTGNGGAVFNNGTFNIGGSAKIFTGTKKKNDVYLCSGKTINITGSLSGSGNIIAVTPNEYKENKTILDLSSESGTTIPNEFNKFKINFDKATDGDFWCIDSSGKLKTELIITSSILENFTPTSSTVYYIKADSSLTNDDVISLFSKIKNNVGTGTSLDLSSTSVTSMDSSMWIYSGITYLTLPDNLNYIQCQLFQNNSQLKEIKISSSNAYFVTEDGILYNKDKTTLYRYPPKKEESTFTLPSSVKKLEYMAFAYDENLVTINGLNKIEDTNYLVFENSKKLKEVDFSGLTTDKLHYAVFKSCSSLQKVTLSSTVKKIGENFIDCPQLIEIHFKSTEPPIIGWNENESYPPSNVIFKNCNANLKFYVPLGSKNAYMNDTTRTGCFNGPLNYLVSNLNSLIVQE